MRFWTYRRACGVVVAILAPIGASTAQAQTVIGYVSGGPVWVHGLGNRDQAWQVGAGGEKDFGRVGVGGAVDYLYFPEVNKTFDGGRGSSSSPAFSAAAISMYESFHAFRANGAHRVQPFVTGRLTVFLSREMPPLLGVGGGVDYWTASRKKGLRIEVRGEQFVLLVFRCGVVFR